MARQIQTDEAAIEQILTRGVDEVIALDSLKEKLRSGKQLRIKLGIDPTSPNIHIGRAVLLLKLRDFQELGHQIVFIVGDFTGVIGDTSDKETERPMLTAEEIEKNKETYFEQVGKLIDLDTAEFRYNSEWLGELTYREIGEQADQFSVADFIARDNIRKRLADGKRVSLREMLYPLMQAYDSVVVKADVEIGGTDQRFNLLSGRKLQEHFNQAPQDVLTTSLILGLDGRKMSSSWGNTINLNDAPADMYGAVMSMADTELMTYFEVCTRVPMEEITSLQEELVAGANPRDLKMRLAREIVALYHSTDAATAAEAQFIETFQRGGVPEDIIEVACTGEETYADALVRAEIISSKSEITRLLKSGAITDMDSGAVYDVLPEKSGVTLKIGKRRFARLI